MVVIVIFIITIVFYVFTELGLKKDMSRPAGGAESYKTVRVLNLRAEIPQAGVLSTTLRDT